MNDLRQTFSERSMPQHPISVLVIKEYTQTINQNVTVCPNHLPACITLVVVKSLDY